MRFITPLSAIQANRFHTLILQSILKLSFESFPCLIVIEHKDKLWLRTTVHKLIHESHVLTGTRERNGFTTNLFKTESINLPFHHEDWLLCFIHCVKVKRNFRAIVPFIGLFPFHWCFVLSAKDRTFNSPRKEKKGIYFSTIVIDITCMDVEPLHCLSRNTTPLQVGKCCRNIDS